MARCESVLKLKQGASDPSFLVFDSLSKYHFEHLLGECPKCVLNAREK